MSEVPTDCKAGYEALARHGAQFAIDALAHDGLSKNAIEGGIIDGEHEENLDREFRARLRRMAKMSAPEWAQLQRDLLQEDEQSRRDPVAMDEALRENLRLIKPDTESIRRY